MKKGKYLFLLVGLALLLVGLTVACQTEPPVILKFSSSPVEISTGESAKLSWVVKDATSVSINHGVGVVENVGNKRVSPPATITYTLIATNSGGTVTKSAVVTVSATSLPSPDTTAPVISAVNTSGTTQSSITITWTTNEEATSQVMYGPTTSYGSTAPSDIYFQIYGPVTSHSVTLSGLSASTTYHFKVKSKEVGGNEAISDDYTFSTSQSTNVGGTLAGNVVWNLANSPYTLTSHLLIPENCVLTIDPGVLVDMSDKFIQIEGTFKVLGTAGQPVKIYCRTNASFSKIVFKPTSIAWNETGQTGSIVQHCLIEGECYAASLISVESSAPKIVNSTIINTNPSSAAINMSQSSSQVVSNNIKGHTGILVYGGSPKIIGNTIQDCDFSGIQLQITPTGATLIERNLIKGSERGLIVSIEKNSRIDIISNTITENQAGIDLGGDTSSISLLAINQNAIYDNTNWNARNYFTDNITMANNWWGTTNPTSIEEELYDNADDFRSGSIIYTPFLSTRPSSSPLP